MRFHLRTITLVVAVVAVSSFVTGADPAVDYTKEVAPILTKYCAGCHNDDEMEGDFSLESFASLQRGVKKKGPAILPGDAKGSLLLRVLTATGDAKMPPEDEPAPSAAEIEILTRWVAAGAVGPNGTEMNRLTLNVPSIASKTSTKPITSIDWNIGGGEFAVARFGEVEIFRRLRVVDAETGKKKRVFQPFVKLNDFPGKVTSVHFVSGGGKLLTSSGVTGRGGVATLWEWPIRKRVRDFQGHRDMILDAELSPNGNILATSSYDRTIILWDVNTGDQLRTLSGHNGAVYDIAFSPDGKTLASASADDTCKVWRVQDGTRLDTMGQPLKEQYAVAYSPDGKLIAAGGADNRIRVWRYRSREKAAINPIMYARFAHEGAIVALEFSDDGTRLVSVGEDQTIKVWETKTFTEIKLINDPTDVSMALAVAPDSSSFSIGRMDGSLQQFPLPKVPKRKATGPSEVTTPVASSLENVGEMATVVDTEPNSAVAVAQAVTLPVKIQGTIHQEGETPDVDSYRFQAKAGQTWVFEVNAARSKSKLDSFIEIVRPDGSRIERVLMQAVRDSYFTFRGKDAKQITDFRIFNWEEMELNEYLYANGEVVRLWLYPRGPDSGFNVYPGSGSRWGYFDTTGLAHALGEPCYIVKPFAPDAEIIPNGLPVFPIYFENDDGSRRAIGSDSKLMFTAPDDGEYIVRIRDVRGFQGADFKYTLEGRPRQPMFKPQLTDTKLNLFRGSHREFRVRTSRLDQFDGPITVDVKNVPTGISITSPITIQEGQIEAIGLISVGADAPELTAEKIKAIQLTGTAEINGKPVSLPLGNFAELNIKPDPKVTLEIIAATDGAKPVANEAGKPLEFEIHPGETIMLQVNATRNNFGGEISFGKEDSGRNLPHGLYVDNIGLNGLLLLNGQTQREFFITAAKWVPEQSRTFHLRTGAADGHATQPVMIHVRPKNGNVIAKP